MTDQKRVDVMVDLETLGLRSNCCILSLGACTFDIFTGEIFNELYLPINLDSNLLAGRTIDQSTFEWWMNQSNEARQALIPKFKHDLDAALGMFHTWYKSESPSCVWSNGENFDIAILQDCYKMTPWKFYQCRDTRTVDDLYQIKTGMKLEIERVGTHHHAIDDCIFQIKKLTTQFAVLTAKETNPCIA